MRVTGNWEAAAVAGKALKGPVESPPALGSTALGALFGVEQLPAFASLGKIEHDRQFFGGRRATGLVAAPLKHLAEVGTLFRREPPYVGELIAEQPIDELKRGGRVRERYAKGLLKRVRHHRRHP